MKNSTRWVIGGGVTVALLAGGVALAVGAVGEDDRPDVALTGETLEQASDAALTHLGEGEVTDSEVDDEDGLYEVEVTLEDGTEVDVRLDEDFTVLGDERDEQVTGQDRTAAAAAATEAAGGGSATEVEVADDGDTGYQVEVQLDDGTFVEVALNGEFTVTAVDSDDD